jgi:hypothetical protein
MDDGDERRSGAKEQAPPKIKAEDNPWYLLATLYGVPGKNDRELAVENRRAWNRYFAKRLNDETRTKFIEEKRHKAEELMPRRINWRRLRKSSPNAATLQQKLCPFRNLAKLSTFRMFNSIETSLSIVTFSPHVRLKERRSLVMLLF